MGKNRTEGRDGELMGCGGSGRELPGSCCLGRPQRHEPRSEAKQELACHWGSREKIPEALQSGDRCNCWIQWAARKVVREKESEMATLTSEPARPGHVCVSFWVCWGALQELSPIASQQQYSLKTVLLSLGMNAIKRQIPAPVSGCLPHLKDKVTHLLSAEHSGSWGSFCH